MFSYEVDVCCSMKFAECHLSFQVSSILKALSHDSKIRSASVRSLLLAALTRFSLGFEASKKGSSPRVEDQIQGKQGWSAPAKLPSGDRDSSPLEEVPRKMKYQQNPRVKRFQK